MINTQITPFGILRATIFRLKETNPTVYFFVFSLWFRRNFRINRKRVRGKQNSVIKCNAILNGVRFDIVGNKNCIEINTMAILDGVTFYIRGSCNKVIIGADCRIANSIIWIEDNRCEITIGRQTTIGGVHLAATEDESKVIIGDDCMLAYDIDIRAGDSHGIYDQSGNRLNKAEDVIIGEHVWIAAHTIILKGVVIGEGSIVGTGAVVVMSGIYPSHSILVGNPAKVIKQGICWTRLRANSYKV